MRREVGELIRANRTLERAEIASQLLHGYGAGEDDVGPGVRQGGGDRLGIAVSKATIGERFLDHHAPAGIVRLGQRGAGGRLKNIPGGLDRLKWVDPVDRDRERPPDHVGLTRTTH